MTTKTLVFVGVGVGVAVIAMLVIRATPSEPAPGTGEAPPPSTRNQGASGNQCPPAKGMTFAQLADGSWYVRRLRAGEKVNYGPCPPPVGGARQALGGAAFASGTLAADRAGSVEVLA